MPENPHLQMGIIIVLCVVRVIDQLKKKKELEETQI